MKKLVIDALTTRKALFELLTDLKNQGSLEDVELDFSKIGFESTYLLGSLKVFIVEKDQYPLKRIVISNITFTISGEELVGSYFRFIDAANQAKVEVVVTGVNLEFFSWTHPEDASLAEELNSCRMQADKIISSGRLTTLGIESSNAKAHMFGNVISQTAVSALLKNPLLGATLNSCNFGEQGLSILAEGLKENKLLYKLDLSRSEGGPKDWDALGKALIQNTGLLRLNLNGTNFAGNSIAEALKTNHTLQSLCISSIKLDDAKFTALAAAMRFNTGLEYLDLSCNMIVEGVTTLVEALRANSQNVLYQLNLSDNDRISQTSLINLCTFLATKSCSINALGLRNLSGSVGVVEAFADAIQKNCSLSEIVFPTSFSVCSLMRKPEVDAVTGALTLVDEFNEKINRANKNLIAALMGNKRMLSWNAENFSGCHQDKFAEHLQQHQEISKRLITQWSRVAVLMGFVGANPKNALRYSVLALLPGILAMSADDAAENTSAAKSNAEEKQVNTSSSVAIKPKPMIDRFVDSMFFREHLLSKQPKQSANLTPMVVVVDQGQVHKRKVM